MSDKFEPISKLSLLDLSKKKALLVAVVCGCGAERSRPLTMLISGDLGAVCPFPPPRQNFVLRTRLVFFYP